MNDNLDSEQQQIEFSQGKRNVGGYLGVNAYHKQYRTPACNDPGHPQTTRSTFHFVAQMLVWLGFWHDVA
jgi:hypothetical protein